MEDTEVLEQPSAEEEVVEEVISEGEEPSEEPKPETEPEPRAVEEPPKEEPVKEVPITETEEFKRLQSEADKRIAEAEEKLVRTNLEREWAEAQAYAEKEKARAQQEADMGRISQEQADAYKAQFSEARMRQDFQKWAQQLQQGAIAQRTKQEEAKRQAEIDAQYEHKMRFLNATKVAEEFSEVKGLVEKLSKDTELKTEKDMRAKAIELAYNNLKAKVRDGSIPIEEYPKASTSTTQTGASDDAKFLEDYANGKSDDHERYQKLEAKFK